MNKKRIIIGMLIGTTVFMLNACGKKTEIDNDINVENYSQSDNTYQSDEESWTPQENEEDSMVISDDEETDFISDNSQLNIINVLSDGRIWGVEQNEDEKATVLFDVNGRVYNRILEGVFPGYCVYGIDSERVAFGDDEIISIYDIETKDDKTNLIVKDFDCINDIFWKDGEPLFSVMKKVQSFAEEYIQYRLVDKNGSILFEISLDNATLNTYRMKKDYVVREHKNIKISQLTNNVYYLSYVGENEVDRLNSLIINIDNNMITPVWIPHGSVTISSDGEFTLASVYFGGNFLINNYTGELMNFPDGYVSLGRISEGKIFASKHDERVILDVDGNVLIDLNNYGHMVENVYGFHNGVGLIEFSDKYVAFINTNGSFLFEPVKGTVRKYDKEHDMAIINDEGNEQVFILDINGSKQIFEGIVPTSYNYFYTTYEGENYWIVESLNRGLKVHHLQ